VTEAARIIDAFGPIAFGLVSLLVLWRYIVAPELARSRSVAELLGRTVADIGRAVESAKEAAASAREAAGSAREAARFCEQAADLITQRRSSSQ
jgi:hypothetical protein